MRSDRRHLIGLAALAGGAGLAWPACTLAAAATGTGAERPLRVVASFSILADIVRNIAGTMASVESLVGSDSDSHVFEPTPLHARRLAEADLVVINGLGFEGWLPRLVVASGYRGPVLVASDHIATRQRQGVADPHIWQDLGNGQQMSRNIEQALAHALPAAAEMLRERGSEYRAALSALDAAIRSRFEAIPRDRRRVVTSHDAFAYFGSAYGVDFLAPLAAGTQNEPSAATVARLSVQIQAQAIRAVFIENISDPRLLHRLAEESGAIVGGKLYSDALSARGGEADSYLRLVGHNAATIASALGGRRVGTLRQPLPIEPRATTT